MYEGYQPPKFQQFDGKANPRQHVEHFIKTCNVDGTYGNYIVKEFVRSLRENVFNWYTILLNNFYSTRHVVSMMKLTKARQGKDELVVDFINHWRSLSLNCKDRLSEISSIEMCIQGMN